MFQGLATLMSDGQSMATSRFDPRHRSRELRRRVILPARVRHSAGWADACILNVSSRGLMIEAARPAPLGDTVEVHRGAQRIIARVVWRDGTRSGLQVDEHLPVEEILSFSNAPGLQLTARDAALVDRRVKPRAAEVSRQRGRAIEYIGVVAIAASLCAGGVIMLEEAFATPMTAIAQVLPN
jgi:hypothetical protein